MNASSEGSPDQQPLLQRIDAICDAFEQALASQPDARVEDFLADWLAAEQAALLAHMLELELDYRSRGGEEIRREEYVARFPDRESLIDDQLARFGEQPDTPARSGDGGIAPSGWRSLIAAVM